LDQLVKECIACWGMPVGFGTVGGGPFKITPFSAYLFKRLLKEMRRDEIDKSFDFESEAGMDIGDLGYALHLRVFEEESKMVNVFNHLYACPGMPQLILFTNLYSTGRLRGKPRKNGRSISDFCYFLFGVLVFSGVKNIQKSMMSFHDGFGNIRKEYPWGLAAATRAAELYIDGWCRYDCGDAMMAGPSLLYTWLKEGMQYTKEWVNKGIICAILESSMFHAEGTKIYNVKSLQWLIQKKDQIDSILTTDATSDILFIFFGSFPTVEDDDEDREWLRESYILLGYLFIDSDRAESRWNAAILKDGPNVHSEYINYDPQITKALLLKLFESSPWEKKEKKRKKVSSTLFKELAKSSVKIYNSLEREKMIEEEKKEEEEKKLKTEKQEETKTVKQEETKTEKQEETKTEKQEETKTEKQEEPKTE